MIFSPDARSPGAGVGARPHALAPAPHGRRPASSAPVVEEPRGPGGVLDIAFPFLLDPRGSVTEATPGDHVRQMIEQVLFTLPGERVNLPDFGCGVEALVFAPENDALATATQFLVMGGLQRWLGDVIQVESVSAATDGPTLSITVAYRLRATRERAVAHFRR
jgi:uncharacterized protein